MAVISLDKSKTALIMADFHVDTMGANPLVKERGVLEKSRALLDAARKAGMLVVYIVVAFREGYPEVHPRNKSFGPLKAPGQPLPTEPLKRIHPLVTPQPGEVVVVKHRVNAFFGTDLDMILRASNIDSLLLLGHATSGVILSTVRYAADADYEVIVVQDCCADRDAGVHAFLVQQVFPRQATVANSEDIIRAISGSP